MTDANRITLAIEALERMVSITSAYAEHCINASSKELALQQVTLYSQLLNILQGDDHA